MTRASFAQKTTYGSKSIPGSHGLTGLHGIAIAPPAYGMDVVDQQPVQAMAEEHQSLESTTWPAWGGAIQRQAVPGAGSSAAEGHQGNDTGLPDRLKAGIESLSGLAIDDVRVHYNSVKPAQLQALAYTKGANIYVGPGQERHLPHEAWHVVQQKQGRVQPTTQAKGVTINDDRILEREADVMGKKAIQMKCAEYEKKAEITNDLLQSKPKYPQTMQFAKGDPCYCPNNKVGPYAALPEYNDQVGPGEDFTVTQVNDIYKANASKSHAAALKSKITSLYISDSDGGELVKFSDINQLVAEVDHIVPQTKGGCNSVKNAQVISSWENSSANKGETYPYGGYSGYSTFNPKKNTWT